MIATLLGGLGLSLFAATVSGAAALVLGTSLGVAASLGIRWLAAVCLAVVNAFRNLPLMIYLYFIYAALPRFGITLPAVICGLLGLSLYTSVFVAEAVRGAIGSIHGGQMEAGLSLGLTRLQVMRHILLPQAITIAVPSLMNTFVTLVKNTSLLATITVPDLMYRAEIIESRTFATFKVYTTVALLYWAVILPLSAAARYVEVRMDREGR